ncbi:hypothetical protein H6768_01180 [Candidatus Peribacteria bacterium]|nr:hypothetical protein [Candidatus Peribacteria bacterium]
MNRFFSYLTLIALFCAQLSPFTVLAQSTEATLKDFEITVPSEVIINEAFDMKVKALDSSGKKYDKYE